MADDDLDPWSFRFEHTDWTDWARPQSGQTTADGIDALAALLSVRWEHLHHRRRSEAALTGRSLPPAAMLVGIAGPVAAGKTRIANAVADRLSATPYSRHVEVVSTDGFLRSNAELEAAGLTLRKGFPESYDLAALRALHHDLRVGRQMLSVPVYSHEAYDVADDPVEMDRPEILILEGVNALQGAPDGGTGPGDLTDVAVYIDAEEEVVIEWYVERFVQLVDRSRRDPRSFYQLWTDLPEDAVRQAARDVWEGVNAVNLREHIRPSRARADIAVLKDASHAIVELALAP